MIFRRATIDDAAAIVEIYNYYIKNSVITFEETIISVEEMADRIEEVTKKFPWFVIANKVEFNENDKIKGYAYANSWKMRESYRYAVESSIYLSPEAQGQGLGKQLYSVLLDELKQLNIHTVIGGIALPNPSSILLHERLGFEKIGQFKEIGYKYNQWVDVGYWQKIFIK